MSGLRVLETLELLTDIGQCQIQLWLGDITALPKEEQVDVLVISAYPGDYSPTPTSLIGQLVRRLKVNVRTLSQDKEEDLRKLYSCWWTKPLPNHLSFRKILCFEGSFKKGKKSGEVVGDVFRCLVSILANKEGTVMMPILASGDQGYSKQRMLQLIVNAAVHWMKAGLPLRCLKIVLFSRDATKLSTADEPIAKLFSNLKKSFEDEEKEQKTDISVIQFDVYLSYSEEDENRAKEVANSLKNEKSDLRIFSTIQQLDMEDSWQDILYKTITSCQRVVAVITPSYLRSSSCIEQYNIALCHSRKIHQSILMPLYVSDVPLMPTYMQITQYIDCRVEYTEKVKKATIIIISSLSIVKTSIADILSRNKQVPPASENYDVFLSYSHCNGKTADKVLKEFQNHNPKLNIFIYTAELKTGDTWQQTLYHALDASRIVIALISKDYLSSKVCLEELSLSIVVQEQAQCKLFPVIIEELENDVEWLSSLSPKKCFHERADQQDFLLTQTCREIVQELKEPKNIGNKSTSSLASLTEEVRSVLFQQENPQYESQLVSTIQTPAESGKTDIYVIFSPDDNEYCELLQKLILSKNPSAVIKTSADGNTTSRLNYLDDAHLVIPLLSTGFMKSSELLHELNIAWCRQRYSPHLCFLAITVDKLPKKPTYIHLLPSFFNCEDKTWQQSSLDSTILSKLNPEMLSTCQCPLKHVLCFINASSYVCNWLKGEDCCFLVDFQDKFFNIAFLRTSIPRLKEASDQQAKIDNDENVRREGDANNPPSENDKDSSCQHPMPENTSREDDVSLKNTASKPGLGMEKDDKAFTPFEHSANSKKSLTAHNDDKCSEIKDENASVQDTSNATLEPKLEDETLGTSFAPVGENNETTSNVSREDFRPVPEANIPDSNEIRPVQRRSSICQVI